MKILLALLALAACSGKPAATVQNVAPPSADPEPTRVDDGNNTRVVTRNASGGLIELAGDRSVAMEKAIGFMTEHCGKDKFVITQEGEERVSRDGEPIATAWRVHYQCN